jgi:ABC-type transport system involved in multi-copper enzyme maturation permease subunit
MIRLAWLQFRAQAMTAAAALALFAVLLAATGPHMASLYAASGISTCRGASCENLASTFLQQLKAEGDAWVYLISVAGILLAPALIGLFWGAPLIAHELETGTSALAWTQSVTRTRWLAVKLTVGGLAAMAVTEGLSLMQAWWAAPIGRAVGHGGRGGGSIFSMGQFYSLVFATHGITPLGYAAFAFTLGVTAGALIGRTVPAMAVTLAIFAVVQIAMPLWIRPHLFPARQTVIPVTSLESTSETQSTGTSGNSFVLGALNLPGQPGAWLLSSGTVNAAGQAVNTAPAICFTPSVENSSNGFVDCLASHGIQETISYQPASRYWPFQWTETAIYLTLTLALAGYCVRRLNRRRS